MLDLTALPPWAYVVISLPLYIAIAAVGPETIVYGTGKWIDLTIRNGINQDIDEIPTKKDAAAEWAAADDWR